MIQNNLLKGKFDMIMKRESYGLICYDKVMKTTLVVQRVQTPDFIHFVRGFYNAIDLDSIFEKFTADEHDLIKELIGCDNLRDKLKSIIPKIYKKNQIEFYVNNGVKKFMENKNTIIDLVNRTQPSIDYEWIWPKGGIHIGETPIECAIRETFEETGYKIPYDKIDSNPITLEIDTSSGNKIVNTYFFVECDSSIIRTGSPDPKEVRKTGWHNYEYLKDRLPPNYSKYLSMMP